MPFILREQRHTGEAIFHSEHIVACKRKYHLKCCIPVLHKVIGQAYVHGLMQYKGGLGSDIESGKVMLQEFFLE